jgi:diguanylate cyclase (GGDEF)-like protein
MNRLTQISGAAEEPPPSRTHAIAEVRRLKRTVMIGVYGAIFGFIPFYAFVLHYTPVQLVIGTIIGLGIAVSAIEGAFNQMYKFRKRSSYPATLLVEAGTTTTQEQAQARLLDALVEILRLDSAAILISDKRDEDIPTPVHGMDPARAQKLSETFAPEIARVKENGRGVLMRMDPVNSRPDGKGKAWLAIVPILAWGRTAGVILMTAAKKKELKDQELLDSIGVAAGVSLENLVQKDNLQDALSVLRATLDSTADGIIVIVGGRRIASYNKRFLEMWQVPREILADWDAGGPRLGEYVIEQLEDPEGFARRLASLRDGNTDETFDVLKFKDGRLFEAYSQPQVVEGAIVGRVWCVRDVTERIQSEQTIRRLAYHDALTELPNRALYTDRLTVAIAQARRTRQQVAVVFLDVDRFKMINDTMGHAAGDEVLKQIAAELSNLVRDGDTVARVGGDEFTLLLTDVAGQDVAAIAGRILDTIRKPRVINQQELHVTTSVGIAMFPQDGDDVETLLRHADTAMYRAKAQGRDCFQTYTPAMSDEIVRRVSTESDLRRALEREEFAVYYQPQLDGETWRITGAEALIRWHHPSRGLILPGDFISVAEDTGLIIPIGEWVLRAACRDARGWLDSGLPPITVTVNLSARQFQQASLVDRIAGILRETGLDARHLELEITEGTTIHDPVFAAKVIEELRSMGVRLSIDDFGTGYSSLSYLKRFKIDRLKIDRSFIDELTTDTNNAAIATAVIAMAHSLGLGVVAEGVETQEQLDFLVQHDCDSFQGYLVGRPEPEPRLRDLLADQRHLVGLRRLARPRLVS